MDEVRWIWEASPRYKGTIDPWKQQGQLSAADPEFTKADYVRNFWLHSTQVPPASPCCQ
jgi:hypothetical protein